MSKPLDELREEYSKVTAFILRTDPLSRLLTAMMENPGLKENSLGDELAFGYGLMMGAEAALWLSMDEDLKKEGAWEARKIISAMGVNPPTALQENL